MEITISRSSLLNALNQVSGAVEKRQTLPILSHVLLSIADKKLRITATDLELQLMATADVIDIKSDTMITVPAKKLMDICRALNEENPIQFKTEGQRLALKSGKSRFQLALLPANEFPSVSMDNAAVSFNLPEADLKSLIDHTAFAMAQQDVRYYLNGMLFELAKDHIHMVATDGHRLALSDFAEKTSVKEAMSVIVPRKGVMELSRLLNSQEDHRLQVHLNINHIHIAHERFQFTSKLIDGKFPDYKRVLPKGADKFAYLDRDQFKQALVRASILCNEKFHGVRLTFKANLLQIEANNPEQEQAHDEIPARYDGPELQFGVNVNYVLDVLNALPAGELKISMSNANSSLLFESEDDSSTSLYVVMPMRL
ncbi:MAG: DNA polymerase III subunit beta [Gammaproteobacteria bacterium CG11_big_fil_rev_8_21_14_0_20_46_22]|nr:MAG: DNA polymerase III subunit beta [Gammaproteobacteria bacterium CG12_big_fil_rev_8_21_14_0_65_46_12]PIR10986.1 MAG: DNA polymerase III subunit beta [Gammaproteobacteria bacterium CG11_big_fil_rev_8_21_14_0_20_46_22]